MVLQEDRAPTRLGPRNGRMSTAAIRATLVAVQRFLRDVRDRDPRTVAVATAAVRDARNAAALLDALRMRHKVEVRVLSGAEEAELAALAAMASLHVACGRVVDLGGGSLQLARIDDGRAARDRQRAARSAGDDSTVLWQRARVARAGRCPPARGGGAGGALGP